MYVLMGRNVNDVYLQGTRLLRECGVRRDSRNGPVLRSPVPVTSWYNSPRERVLFDPVRDANPFFHLLESLWMLAGRNDVAFPAGLVARMKEYSDNGTTLHSAYGYRWRQHFGVDQLKKLVWLFKRDPETRRAILGIWDPVNDLAQPSKDLPCNTTVKFELVDGALNMVVFNRSNDIIWGAYGANVVQFSMLQEYLASVLGAQVGWYQQVSTDFHAYVSEWERLGLHKENGNMPLHDLYSSAYAPLVQMVQDEPGLFLGRVEAFLTQENMVLRGQEWNREPFLAQVAAPMLRAYQARQTPHTAMAYLKDHSLRCDWTVAGLRWLKRRAKKLEATA